MNRLIDSLYEQIRNPTEGLPEEIFSFVSEITPIINVDLLITNDDNLTLLTWRDDSYCGSGWHIPGGIIRYKETISMRIHAVATRELNVKIKHESVPLAINELIHPTRQFRGHFISLLYKCSLMNSLDTNLEYKLGVPKAGEWSWHSRCPDDLIKAHYIYREYI